MVKPEFYYKGGSVDTLSNR